MSKKNQSTRKNQLSKKEQVEARHQRRQDQRLILPASLAIEVAPEDLEPGDYIAPLAAIEEYVPFLCACDPANPSVPVAKYESLEGSCEMLRVRGVCLPFVLIGDHLGQVRTLDVRRYRFARLPKAYAEQAWRLLRRVRTS